MGRSRVDKENFCSSIPIFYSSLFLLRHESNRDPAYAGISGKSAGSSICQTPHHCWVSEICDAVVLWHLRRKPIGADADIAADLLAIPHPVLSRARGVCQKCLANPNGGP